MDPEYSQAVGHVSTLQLLLDWDLDLDGQFDDASDSYVSAVNTGAAPTRIPHDAVLPLRVANADLPESFHTPGTYEIQLRASGLVGISSIATATVIVTPEPTAASLVRCIVAVTLRVRSARSTGRRDGACGR